MHLFHLNYLYLHIITIELSHVHNIRADTAKVEDFAVLVLYVI